MGGGPDVAGRIMIYTPSGGWAVGDRATELKKVRPWPVMLVRRPLFGSAQRPRYLRKRDEEMSELLRHHARIDHPNPGP
jgi:hypothetical protein